ncbi:unnamed protein product [Chrysodeixis includens]|uniref:Uncharacterized protein n=1 Tax=Chrysodeixis includens TaxID=689277 RepID=A0A9P0G0L0_CHRIL|nr:unnamed protein product [Chrysodeixis includens]
MEQLQHPPTIPHLVQVYQPSVSNTKIQNPQIIHISHPGLPTSQGKVTYQQTITSESIHIPVTSQHVTEIQSQIQMSQNQIVMSCQQGLHSIQPLHGQVQSQVLQSSDMTQSLQIASHVILPQHMLVNGVQSYYSQYEYPKEQCLLAKLEPDLQLVEKDNECGTDSSQAETELQKKRSRSQVPDPTSWACNVRKLKHQRGEAYISRRGKFVPERRIRNTKDCVKNCKFKCNEKITDEDREHIFKAFYSLNANEKKYFLLSTTERSYIKHNKVSNHKRKYTFKYFFLVKSDRHTVCKNFYLGTLAISQKPVYNVHMGKTDLNMPKPDGRGHSKASTHSLPSESKDKVRKHIQSFTTIETKPIVQFSKKKQYLDPSLSVKQMYNMYFSECNKENAVPVKESMYRKIFRQEFNLHFRKIKTEQQLCGRCKNTIKKK